MKSRIREDIAQAIQNLEGVQGVDVEFSAQVRRSPMQQVQLPGVKNIIAIGSGKGGVGKSTVAVLTALSLSRAGARVGLLDADIYGPSIPKMLGAESARPYGTNDKILPVETCGLKVMSIGFMIEPERAVIWRGPMIHGTVKQFLEQVEWGELDYLIVDLPPGTGDVPLTLSQSIPMTGAVIVCTPQDVALADAIRAAKMYQQLNVPLLGIIENMSYFIAPDTGKEYDLFGKGGTAKAAEQLQIPFLGSIPINVAIRISGDQGTPQDLFQQNPQGIYDAIEQAAEALAGQISVHNVQKSGPSQADVHR
jgi:ATP-binding protein involved in chromosome partitioning